MANSTFRNKCVTIGLIGIIFLLSFTVVISFFIIVLQNMAKTTGLELKDDQWLSSLAKIRFEAPQFTTHSNHVTVTVTDEQFQNLIHSLIPIDVVTKSILPFDENDADYVLSEHSRKQPLELYIKVEEEYVFFWEPFAFPDGKQFLYRCKRTPLFDDTISSIVK